MGWNVGSVRRVQAFGLRLRRMRLQLRRTKEYCATHLACSLPTAESNAPGSPHVTTRTRPQVWRESGGGADTVLRRATVYLTSLSEQYESYQCS
eukprot:1642701-Rhodomonas_salina.1